MCFSRHFQETVAQVIVVNRGDCCWDRLDGFEVRVGNDLSPRRNAKCGKYGRTKPGETIKIVCPLNLRGRYVAIILYRWTVLTLCEVEVYRKLT